MSDQPELTPEEREALTEDGDDLSRAIEGSGAFHPDFDDAAEADEDLEAKRRKRLKALLRLEVPVIVRLAEKYLPLQQILKLSEGSIIQFEKAADATLDLLVSNRVIGIGEAVKVGENFGLQIKDIGTPKETIRKLGSSKRLG